MGKRDLARDISYAASGRTKGGRTVIRLLENATGRLSLVNGEKPDTRSMNTNSARTVPK